MKAKNKLSILAGALAACAALVPFDASAAGNILRMDSTSSFPALSPAHIGSEVTFRMILLNYTDADEYDTPWTLKYKGAGSEAFDLAYNPPTIAVLISGEERFARLTQVRAYNGTYSKLSEMNFVYSVKPGDMAAPMEVVYEGGALKFLNLGPGRLWDIRTPTDTVSADLSFCGDSEPVEGVTFNSNYNLTDAADTFGQGPVYIKTLDFDSATIDVDGVRYWRSIPENSEMANIEPKIVIEGGSAATNGTVYVWVSDETGTNISTAVDFGSDMYTEMNAFGQKVHPISFAAGDADKTFTLRGLSTNGTGTAYIYLCAQKQNTFATGDHLVSNFTYRVVKVTEALPPTVWFTIDAESANCPTNWRNHVATLTVHLSEAYPADVTVNLNMKTSTRDAATLFATNSIGVADVSQLMYADNSINGQNNWTRQDTTVVVKAGQLTGQAYLYALGAESEAIEFTPSVAAPAEAVEAYSVNTTVCSFKIYPCTPVISLFDSRPGPVIPPDFVLTEKKAYNFHISLADGYRSSGKNGETAYTHSDGYPGYTIVWDRESDKAATAINPQTFTNILPVVKNGYLVLPLSVTYPYAGVYSHTKITITSPDGQSAELTAVEGNPITVTVAESKKANVVIERTTYAEGEEARISFTLSEPYQDLEGNMLYAFLQPMNADASNLVESANWAVGPDDVGTFGKGIRFDDNSTTTGDRTAVVKFNDGPCSPLFGVRFCKNDASTDTFDPLNEVTDYSISPFTLSVTNTPPWVTSISCGDDTVFTSGGRFFNPVVEGVDTTFELDPNDRAPLYDIGGTNMETALIARWRFYDEGMREWETVWKPFIGVNEYSNRCSYAFSMGGTTNNQVVVVLIDKDMRGASDTLTWDDAAQAWKPSKSLNNLANQLEETTPFKAFVDVTSQPQIIVRPSLDYFSEEDFLNNSDNVYLDVGLSKVYKDGPLDVKLHIERIGDISSAEGKYQGFIATYELEHTFARRTGLIDTNPWRVDVKDLDGVFLTESGQQGRYRFWAEVLTPNTSYGSVTNSSFVVNNSAPSLDGTSIAGYTPNTESNAYTVAKDAQIPVYWTVSDVLNDLTNGLKVTISCPGGFATTSFVYNASSPAQVFDLLSHSVTGTWSFAFGAPGTYKVTVRAEDKDNRCKEYYTEWYWYFTVAAAKNVFLVPLVQDGAYVSTGTSAKPYIGAKARGKGSGRVWSGWGLDEGVFSSVASFKQKWTYAGGIRTSFFFGKGYQVGDVEGSLTPGDIDIDPYGDGYVSGDHYAYPDATFDSFFYRWAVSVSDTAGSWTTTFMKPQPQWGKNVRSIEGSTPLAEQEDDPTKSYPDILVEGIFSKELYAADNLGDINFDGIPDFYAVDYADEMGGGDDGESTDANADLVNLAQYNEDGDFLPAAASASDPFNPGSVGWGPGRPFTFLMEIRGFHQGLNETGISDFDLSDAEAMALLADWASAGNDPTGIYTNDYAAATNWATQMKWSCERRLDPTNADSDNDGLDDGTEYFFWYYSRVGRFYNGKWERLTGRRFSSYKYELGTGVEIPYWVVAARFDPLQYGVSFSGFGNAAYSYEDRDANSAVLTGLLGASYAVNLSDFDEDGLSDLEELALGLNPIDWDSDGDGMPDLFEILNGLDPLNPDDGGRQLGAAVSVQDQSKNPDRDFMAWMTSTNTFKVFTLHKSATDTRGVTYGVDANEYPIIYDWAQNFNADGNPIGYATNDCYLVESAGKKYYVAPGFKIVVDRYGIKYLAAEALAYASLEEMLSMDDLPEEAEEFGMCSGKAEVLPAGTRIDKMSDDVVVACPVSIVSITERGMRILLDDGRDVDAAGIEMFQYGKDGISGRAPIVPVPLDGTSMSEVDTKYRLSTIEMRNVTYIHNQVMNVCGFDPRTGWCKNLAGYVSDRWSVENTTEGQSNAGDKSGLAVNTVPYSSVDEYLVLQYRTSVRGDLRAREAWLSVIANNEAIALANMYSIGNASVLSMLAWGTTRANIPFSAGDGMIGTNASTFASEIHGADTDFDGIPDGWELYVNINPNFANDATSQDDWAKDGDNLNFLEEFAGTDSTAAYSNRFDAVGEIVYPECATIVANHPGAPAPGKLRNWYNKFFPTNPYDPDTDADGLQDHLEGGSWNDVFPVGRNEYDASFTFIYGEPADNGTSKCIPGAGLNPCTVDTDGDLLPDPWEYEFAGVVVEDGKDKAGLSPLDLQRILADDGLQSAAATTNSVTIRGGMDGTVRDANYDYDHDGLMNYQEYLVQTLRHLRYDDAETPLMGRQLVWDEMKLVEGPFVKFLPMSAWDAETFYAKCLDAGFTAGSAFKYRELGYFAPPVHEWDPVAQRNERILLRPYGLASSATPANEARAPLNVVNGMFQCFMANDLRAYASTDPRMWDSDNDGMDDYYELFHGLNPLLGSAADPEGTNADGFENAKRYDRIASIYGPDPTSGRPAISAWRNAWTDWSGAGQPSLDAMRFPWLIGTAECDADGDGLRNSEEALMMNVTAPQPTHTDPTPLWMTDSSSTNFSSYVAQYYRGDPDLGIGAAIFTHRKWSWTQGVVVQDIGVAGATREYMYAFEENEGYDTDHDFIPDNQELVKDVSQASSPLDQMDPIRRQGLWFSGENSAAVTSIGTLQHPASTSYDMLRQFTVEAWVKAEDPAAGREQVIIERSANYGASSLSNGVPVIRANFRLGVNSDGNFFGAFEGSTANSGEQLIVGPPATTNWTHLALTFDGSVFALRVNGNSEPAAQSANVGLIPANGIVLMEQEAGYVEHGFNEFGYQTVPCAMVLGARAVGAPALNLIDKPTWADYGSFFKGWVDEVRVWNRARTGTEIHENYAKAFSREDLVELRKADYTRWLRNDRSEATLLQHYNFDGLPGAVDAADATVEPSGFTKNVADQVRIEGGAVPDGIVCGWWASAPVRSDVYNNAEVVPWVANNVAHLPFLDGSAIDSQYWAENYAGIVRTEDAEDNLAYYEFPNVANPYPYYRYIYDRYWHMSRAAALDSLRGESSSTNNVATGAGNDIVVSTTREESLSLRWRYELERNFVGTSDIVPLGGAFAKRCGSFWDGYGPMDAWENTVLDSDGDGLPDWWEALYAGVGVNPEVLTPATLVDYYGRGVADTPAWEAYLLDLAKGMLPGGTVDEAFAAKGDSDSDGMPDYWERIYGIDNHSYKDAVADPDRDGLANFAEFAVQKLGYWHLSPMLSASAFSGQTISDYYLPVGKLYLGEMFTDHDMMEDELEDETTYMSRSIYDAHVDGNGSGWSNWAELRASQYTNTWIKVGEDTVYEEMTFLESSIEHTIWLTTNTCEIVRTEIQYAANGRWFGPSDVHPLADPFAYRYTVVLHPPIIAYGGRPRPQVKAKIHYNGRQSVSNVVVKAWKNATLTGNPIAVWKSVTFTPGFAVELGDPDEGWLKEGRWTFEVFGVSEKSDSSSGSGSGSGGAQASTDYSVGAPYGFVNSVDVGYAGADFEIEITDTNPSVMRIDLAQAIGANEFGSQTALNDRGLNGYITANEPAETMDEMPASSSGVRVRLARYAINGAWRGNYDATTHLYRYPFWVVYEEIHNLGADPCLLENVLFRNTASNASTFDLDWGLLAGGAGNVGISYSDISTVTYGIIVGDQPVAPGTTNNMLATMFVNKFEQGSIGNQTKAVPVSPSSALKDAVPTFKWTHNNTIGKSYPAFQLRVYRTSDSKLIYDTGIRRAPAKDASGAYSFTPETLHVGEAVAPGLEFANNQSYYWTVSMMDAKFYQPNNSETRREFRTLVDGSGGTLSDKGSIAVAVKYFGPGTTTTNVTTFSGLIRVEAFARPDFHGIPAAATYVRNKDNLSNPSNSVWNATLVGLDDGEWYVRAYIDTNGNRTHDDWESWGYGNFKGTERTDIYTPRAYTIKNGSFEVPSAVITLDDADTNGNKVPDIYEWVNGVLTDSVGAPANSPYIVTINNSGTSTVSLFDTLSDELLSMPYIDFLRNLRDGGIVSSVQMAMIGINLANADTDARVRITSYSRLGGVKLAVSTPTTIDGEPLVTDDFATVSVKVSLTLWYKEHMEDEWTEMLTVSDTFVVNEVDGELDPDKLEALNAKLRAASEGQSGFFKVTIE